MSEGLRTRLGRVGVWSAAPANAPAAEVREALPGIEALGYPAIWYPEGPSRETFVAASLALASSERIAVCSGIANIYARDPTAMMNGGRSLAEAFPGRFVLGLGVSHRVPLVGRGHEYRAAVPTMRAYLDAMEQALYMGPEPPEPAPIVLAALGPLMLKLAAERTAGAHPYFTTVEHTARARELLGPDPDPRPGGRCRPRRELLGGAGDRGSLRLLLPPRRELPEPPAPAGLHGRGPGRRR